MANTESVRQFVPNEKDIMKQIITTICLNLGLIRQADRMDALQESAQKSNGRKSVTPSYPTV